MICKRCGAPVNPQAIFCEKCGAPYDESTNLDKPELQFGNGAIKLFDKLPELQEALRRINQKQALVIASVVVVVIICCVALAGRFAAPQTLTSSSAKNGSEKTDVAGSSPSTDTLPHPTPQIVWRNPLFESLIRQRLGKPTGSITEAELNSITTLHILGDFCFAEYYDYSSGSDSAQNRADGSFSMDGRSYARGRLENIEDITKLKNLRELSICCTSIRDIAPLVSLKRLERLSLTSNINLRNIQPLASMQQLSGKLSLWRNAIEDITPLSNLSSVTDMQLSSNRIVDVSPLANLTNLEELNLYINFVTDVSPLSGLTNLSVLNLGLNKVSDASPLHSLLQLKKLSLRNNQLSPAQISALQAHLPACTITATDQLHVTPSTASASAFSTEKNDTPYIEPYTTVYRKANTNSQSGITEPGDTIAIVGETSNFYKAIIDGSTCYVLKKDVQWK